jgi:hypothetical protein
MLGMASGNAERFCCLTDAEVLAGVVGLHLTTWDSIVQMARKGFAWTECDVVNVSRRCDR